MARDIGDISSLFPRGITRVTDLPYTIHDAIISALMFLTFDELPDNERPPKTIWLNGEKMKAHWAEVKRMRKAEAEGHGDPGDMTKNALKDKLLVGF